MHFFAWLLRHCAPSLKPHMGIRFWEYSWRNAKQGIFTHPLSSAAASEERLTLQEYTTLNFLIGP